MLTRERPAFNPSIDVATNRATSVHYSHRGHFLTNRRCEDRKRQSDRTEKVGGLRRRDTSIPQLFDLGMELCCPEPGNARFRSGHASPQFCLDDERHEIEGNPDSETINTAATAQKRTSQNTPCSGVPQLCSTWSMTDRVIH